MGLGRQERPRRRGSSRSDTILGLGQTESDRDGLDPIVIGFRDSGIVQGVPSGLAIYFVDIEFTPPAAKPILLGQP